MSSLFKDATQFNEDISRWDVSNVKSMSNMFYGAESFDNFGKPLNWGEKTKNVEDMAGMFGNAWKFNQDISDWEVSNVKDMSRMFVGATEFNQDISGWDVNNVPPWNRGMLDITATRC
jgi:surface protein